MIGSVLVGLLIADVSYASAVSAVGHTLRQATSHQPEKLTELYFTDYQSIPKTARAQKVYIIPFTVTNQEASPMQYPYEILLRAGGQTKKISSGVLNLRDKEAKNTSFAVTFDRPHSTYQVTVKLLNKNQQINVRIAT